MKDTPLRWLTTYRMNLAVDKVMNTDMSIGDISDYIGYQSEAYFISVFKKKFGKTPKQFRISFNQQI